jgi:UDP-N-acetylglucosamine transferase subunit ALG13
MSGTYNKPLVVVTVGGDHHPFNRLMGWVEDWLFDFGDRARCLVQHGSAPPPRGADATPYIAHQDLLAAMASARVVISSGGPATLAEARQLGHRPLAVPRLASLGEVVDDHQRTFTQRLADLGLVVKVETEEEFRSSIAAALDAPRIVPPQGGALPAARISHIGELIDSTARLGIQRRSRKADAGRHMLAGR